MPGNELYILRLLWNPDDVEGDIVKPSAFPSSQLDGKTDEYISVDRADQSIRSVMESTARLQQQRADGERYKRHSPMLAQMQCGDVRSILLEGRPALAVKPYPLETNAAHCGIENIVGKLGRGAVTEIRNKLTKLSSPPLTFDQAYGHEQR